MNTNWCYSGFGWKVYNNNNTFLGYIVASSQYDAYNLAKDKYGNHIWVERISAPSYNG